MTDQSGGALPGVAVTATNEQTGLAQTATTDTSAGMSSRSLPAASYKSPRRVDRIQTGRAGTNSCSTRHRGGLRTFSSRSAA